MGSKIETNDTLKISKERGFPLGLEYENHIQNPKSTEPYLGLKFSFKNPEERLYNRPPTRVHLVQEMPDGKWLYWGHAMVIEQTIGSNETKGTYKITRIHTPEYQRIKTDEESPIGRSFFGGAPQGLFIE